MQIPEYFSQRHTVRQYSDKEISTQQLNAMLDAASHAPNTGNMQWYSVIVTRDDEQKRRLAPLHFGQPQICDANVVLTFCIDLRRFELWCRKREAEPGFDNFQSFVASMIDTSLVAQQLCTVAEMQGIGTCYLGTTTYKARQIAEVLDLPVRVVPVATVTLGYPSSGKVADGGSWRLPVSAWVHDETYHEPSAADIDSWYASLEADPQSQKFIDENNKKTLAQVFTDVRYPRTSAEQFSKAYLDFIKENGFGTEY
ncbi:MAG: nitroreductase family protein [Bacteroidales bacterium]|nr:nitroreductase family protein [Bacteroidales bacterium]